MGKDGSKVKARYTYIYVFEAGEWKISQHHSSKMPEAETPTVLEPAKNTTPTVLVQTTTASKVEPPFAKCQTIQEGQVRDLFNHWNNALDTLNPSTVA